MPHSPLQFRKSAEEQAADWAARLGAGPLAEAESEALRAWTARNEAHGPLLEEVLGLNDRLKDAIPGMVRAGRLAVPTRRRRTAPAIWAARVAAAVAFGAGLLWFASRPKELSTDFAQRQSITLADGTVADLNARTEMSVALGRGDRRVRFTHGEAYFSVAKDPARPFYVETPAGTVRVTGTHFEVRAVDPGTLEVTVLEGSVAVTPAAALSGPVVLKEGDQFAVADGAVTTRRLAPEAARDAIAWREGRIVFDGAPLRLAVSRFTQYDGRAVDVAPEVASLRLGGTFQLDDLEGFLRDISSAVPVRVLKAADGSIRLLPR